MNNSLLNYFKKPDGTPAKGTPGKSPMTKPNSASKAKPLHDKENIGRKATVAKKTEPFDDTMNVDDDDIQIESEVKKVNFIYF